MAREVFVSYAGSDKGIADTVVEGLERAGISCWIAPRDIEIGENYSHAIIGAIRSCRLMLVVFSAASNESPYVMNEVERAFHTRKRILPYRIENVEMCEEMEFFLSRPQWLNAHQGDPENNIQRLVTSVRAVLDGADSGTRRIERPKDEVTGGSTTAENREAETLGVSTPGTESDQIPSSGGEDSGAHQQTPSASNPEMDLTVKSRRNRTSIGASNGPRSAMMYGAVMILCVVIIGVFLKSAFTHTESKTDHPINPSINGAPKITFSSKGNVELVSVPAGEFLMGDDDRLDNKRHTVYLDAFSIGKSPVTVAQFRAYCSDQTIDFGKFRAPRWGWIEDHPMVNVSRGEARAYCLWAGGDLPTEAQWEKAARGTDGRLYPWGNDWDGTRLQWSSDGQFGSARSTAPITAHPDGMSPYGCLDMAGNVFQWCTDWYAPIRSSEGVRNPRGPDTGTVAVLRGGSWFANQPGDFRSAGRMSRDQDALDDTGFRLACPQ